MIRNESMPEWNELQKLIEENLPEGTQYIMLINEPGKEDMINLVRVKSKENGFNMALTFAADVSINPPVYEAVFHQAIEHAKDLLKKIQQ